MSQIKEGVEDNHKQLNMIYQEIVSIQTHMHHLEKKTSDSIKINAPRIDPSQLQIPEPSEETKKRPNNPKILKRIYLRNSTEVACKLHDKSIDKILYTQKNQGYLAILGKLGESSNILKFYGISNIDNREVLVFEWAEMGTLKEVYESRDIPWITKIPIALDICRGIAFLNSINIFHHDVRCENVMPKLANFKFARMFDDATLNLTDILKVIHWLAPEKMLEHKHDNNNKNYKRPYTQKCEIFSFGMLLWELCFEKVHMLIKFESILEESGAVHPQAVYTSRFISLKELVSINSQAVCTNGIINDDNKIIESQENNKIIESQEDNIPIEHMNKLMLEI
ncbi:kinase-like protein [Gigaspora margarita]|uniref:Kinase-like protein n=1 Tax=Gigaspora margarita TaxID=4874 RepID=A0A8H4ANI5_GIGMA|nr:kinase-like protein [Gigaspora margarita]